MSAQQLPHAAPDPDVFEFELTDFSDARQALDEPPPGVTTAHTLVPGYWSSQRRKPCATDRALTGAAIDWLLRMPPALRPTHLCESYPRIINAIAAVWPQPQARAEFLDELLTQRRPQRAGFPAAVRAEVEALKAAAETGRP